MADKDKKNLERIKVEATEKIVLDEQTSFSVEQELKQLTKEELIYRLHFVETNPKTIKLIKKILKAKK